MSKSDKPKRQPDVKVAMLCSMLKRYGPIRIYEVVETKRVLTNSYRYEFEWGVFEFVLSTPMNKIVTCVCSPSRLVASGMSYSDARLEWRRLHEVNRQPDIHRRGVRCAEDAQRILDMIEIVDGRIVAKRGAS